MQAPDGTPARRALALATCVAFGVLLALSGPPADLAAFATGVGAPEELAARAWTLLAIFAAVILGLVLRPFATGPTVLIGIVALMVSGAAEPDEVTAGYGRSVTWLVVAAFVVSGALLRTGLGRRIALHLVVRLGRTTLGLAYALSAADLVLAPVVPSNTARGGGILAPIFRSLAAALGSEPDEDPRRAGSFLAFSGAMATVTTSAMFLTAMAANVLVSEAARDVMGVTFDWGTWALAMCVPGGFALAVLPALIHRVYPPTLRDTSVARAHAYDDLVALGPPSRDERILAAVFALLVLLWSTTPLHGMKTVVVAWIGVAILIVTHALPYGELLGYRQTWDALLWLGGLLSMAMLLKARGLVAWFAAEMALRVDGLAPMAALLALSLVYFYSMYGFSMLTAHITAMVGAFLAVLVAVDAPPLVSVALFAAFSNVCACLTIYSTGPVILYFGFGYVPAGKWFQLGALVSLVQLVAWLGVGLAWWKLLGWW